MMSRSTWSAFRPAVHLHHLISLGLLFGCQQAINLRVQPQVVNHLIGHQLRLLTGKIAHYVFVELTVRSGCLNLLAKVIEFGVSLFFSCLLCVEQALDLRFLRIRQVQFP